MNVNVPDFFLLYKYRINRTYACTHVPQLFILRIRDPCVRKNTPAPSHHANSLFMSSATPRRRVIKTSREKTVNYFYPRVYLLFVINTASSRIPLRHPSNIADRRGCNFRGNRNNNRNRSRMNTQKREREREGKGIER